MPAATLLLLLGFALPPGGAVVPIEAQVEERTDCPPCAQARVLLAEADTIGAISLLRDASSEEAPAELWGELGLLLTRIVPGLETDFTGRMEADDALERALDLEPHNPRWLYAYGLLLRKQGMRVDARRMFDRALDAASAGEGSLDSAQTARIHAELGRILEEHVLDFRGLIPNADRQLPIMTPNCSGGGLFCENFARPNSFHEVLLSRPTADDVVDDDLERMRASFETAFAFDPSLSQAARGWLGELARNEDWTRFTETARGYVEASDGAGWSRIFLGAGLHRLARPAEADSQFQLGLASLPDGERSILENISELVTSEVEQRYRGAEAREREAALDYFWTLSDPLYLTDTNERFLEHLARTALAELWFGVPTLELRGYETDRGAVLIRYGIPNSIRQVRRAPSENQGGRYILWTYQPDMPSFIFEKQPASRHASHAINSASKFFTEDLRARHPSNFALENFDSIPYQIARFKGDDSEIEADVFAAMPADWAETGASAGLFFLPQSTAAEVTRLTTALTLGDTAKVVTFRVPLDPGSYPFSVEAASDDGRIRAVTRGSIEAEGFGADLLSLSDVVLARSITAGTTDAQVKGRRDLLIRPAADLSVRQGDPVALYFEIYGLSIREEGAADSIASYGVKLQMTDGDDRGAIGRVLGGIGRLLGAEATDGAIEWERTISGASDRIPEWLAVTLDDREPGSYTVQVTVTDLFTGSQVTGEREFTVIAR